MIAVFGVAEDFSVPNGIVESHSPVFRFMVQIGLGGFEIRHE